MNQSKLFILGGFCYLLSACSHSASDNISQAVQTHMTAVDSVTATTACTNAFEKSLDISSVDFCEALLKRTDAELSICEADIRNVKYKNLISNCEQSLLTRLLKIEDLRNQGLSVHANVFSTEPLNLNFTLATQIQYRDLTSGYLAASGDVQSKQVILSFDDGPDPVNSRSILRTLNETQTKVHFFEVGQRIKASPETTKLIASMGHSIGNHSWDHPNMQKMSFEDSVSQIKETFNLLYSILGWVDPFFRYPYGNRTTELDQFLAQNQIADFLWSIDSNDWKMINDDQTIRTNLQVVEETMSQLLKKQRGIIILHDVHQRTAELLPELLKRIYENGFTSVILQPSDSSLKTHPPVLAGVKPVLP